MGHREIPDKEMKRRDAEVVATAIPEGTRVRTVLYEERNKKADVLHAGPSMRRFNVEGKVKFNPSSGDGTTTKQGMPVLSLGDVHVIEYDDGQRGLFRRSEINPVEEVDTEKLNKLPVVDLQIKLIRQRMATHQEAIDLHRSSMGELEDMIKEQIREMETFTVITDLITWEYTTIANIWTCRMRRADDGVVIAGTSSESPLEAFNNAIEKAMDMKMKGE
jgi:hypothetical protein